MTGTVLYDGVCGLCKSIVAFIRKRDSLERFRFVALQSDEGRVMIGKTGLPEKDTNTVFYFLKDRFYIRSTAVLHILKDLGSGWKIFYIFVIVPRFIRDYIYRIIARNRYRFFGNK